MVYVEMERLVARGASWILWSCPQQSLPSHREVLSASLLASQFLPHSSHSSQYMVGADRRSSHSALVSKEADTDCVIDRHSLVADCKEG